MQRLQTCLFLALVLILFAGCSDFGNGPAPELLPKGPQVSFAASVKPVLDTYCIGCHGGSGNFFVTTLHDLKTTGDHGPNVVSGDGAGSHLVQKLLTNPPFGSRMPFGGPYLSQETIDTIKLWIDQGAQDN